MSAHFLAPVVRLFVPEELPSCRALVPLSPLLFREKYGPYSDPKATMINNGQVLPDWAGPITTNTPPIALTTSFAILDAMFTVDPNN